MNAGYAGNSQPRCINGYQGMQGAGTLQYGGPKGPTQTKKENANKKEHIVKEIKKTQTKMNTSPNQKRKRTQKKAQCKQKSTTQT